MRGLRLAVVLTRHLWRVRRAGQLRFRLETFGAYYPSFPYSTPVWRVSPRGVRLLVQRLTAYTRWLDEMEALRTRGERAWWSGRRRSGHELD